MAVEHYIIYDALKASLMPCVEQAKEDTERLCRDAVTGFPEDEALPMLLVCAAGILAYCTSLGPALSGLCLEGDCTRL